MPGPPARQPVRRGASAGAAAGPARRPRSSARGKDSPRHGARRHDRARADVGAPQDGDLRADPDVVPDPHRRLDQALVLDGDCGVLRAVVEVADVDVVAEQARLADADVEVAVDGVADPDHRLGADPHRALVRADAGPVPEVGVGADHHAGVAVPHLEPHVLADERGALEGQPRVGRHRPRHPQVAEQVVAAVGPVRDDPAHLPEQSHDPTAAQDGFTPVMPTL